MLARKFHPQRLEKLDVDIVANWIFPSSVRNNASTCTYRNYRHGHGYQKKILLGSKKDIIRIKKNIIRIKKNIPKP